MIVHRRPLTASNQAACLLLLSSRRLCRMACPWPANGMSQSSATLSLEQTLHSSQPRPSLLVLGIPLFLVVFIITHVLVGRTLNRSRWCLWCMCRGRSCRSLWCRRRGSLRTFSRLCWRATFVYTPQMGFVSQCLRQYSPAWHILLSLRMRVCLFLDIGVGPGTEETVLPHRI